MFEAPFKFELPHQHRSIIKVIGVGGGGSNAVNHMYNQGIKDVEFVVCNTDAQALRASPVPNKVQLGASLTEGLGAGANPERGRDAALESENEIKELFTPNTKMVFITAGMGGGTGTGAAPVIARIAQGMGVLTVAIVTAPFGFEGRIKKEHAYAGIEELKQGCDTVLLILNDRLRDIYGELPKRKAFAEADNILTNAAKSIAEIITVPGYVNVDFEDVKKVMKNAGQAVMGSAISHGETRARKVIEEALNSPLLNNRDIRGAKKILLTMFYSSDAEMTMDEQTVITDYIEEKTGKEVDELILGDVIDDTLGPNLRVTIIATGFEEMGEHELPKKRVIDLITEREVKVEKPQQEPFTGNKYAGSKPDETTAPIFQGNTPIENYRWDLTGAEPQQEEYEAPVRSTLEEEAIRRKILMERREQLKRMSSDLSQEDFKEKLEIPAYIRRNTKLSDMPHSSDRTVSRFNLDDDDQILGNNKFLHDNVD